MSVLTLLLVLALLGAGAWLLITYVPMPSGIRSLIIVVVVVIGILYVLKAFGIGLPNLQVPTVK